MGEGEWLGKLFDQPSFEAQMKVGGLTLLPSYPQVIEHIYSCEHPPPSSVHAQSYSLLE